LKLWTVFALAWAACFYMAEFTRTQSFFLGAVVMVLAGIEKSLNDCIEKINVHLASSDRPGPPTQV